MGNIFIEDQTPSQMYEIVASFNTLLHLTVNAVHIACDRKALSIWRPVIGSNFRTIAETVHLTSDTASLNAEKV